VNRVADSCSNLFRDLAILIENVRYYFELMSYCRCKNSVMLCSVKSLDIPRKLALIL
jgi:hypothetical protein